MQWKRAWVLALVAGTLAILTPALADSNDVGDGSPNCNGGEICLFDYHDNPYRTAHFWWNESRYRWASGAIRYWFNTVTFQYVTPAIDNTVSMVRNRDSVCNVGFFQRESWQWNPGEYTLIPNNHAYYWIPAFMDPAYTPGADGISSHYRCP